MLQRLICFGLLILGGALWLGLPGAHGQAFELNADGRQLIVQATQAYDSDLRDRPVMADAAITAYVQGITHRLISHAKSLPSGVRLHIAAPDSPKPEIYTYTYTDGHLALSSGLLFGVDNEARLVGLLAPQIARLSVYANAKRAGETGSRQYWRSSKKSRFPALKPLWMSSATNRLTRIFEPFLWAGHVYYREGGYAAKIDSTSGLRPSNFFPG